MTSERLSAGQIEEFELEELEARAARLVHQWIERVVGELEAIGTGDLERAAARAEQAASVLELLDRSFAATERIRSVLH